MTIPTPPKQTGNPTEDSRAIIGWAYQLYNDLVMVNNLSRKLPALKAVEVLNITISASPTQDEVEEIRDKLNEIITILRL